METAKGSYNRDKDHSVENLDGSFTAPDIERNVVSILLVHNDVSWSVDTMQKWIPDLEMFAIEKYRKVVEWYYDEMKAGQSPDPIVAVQKKVMTATEYGEYSRNCPAVVWMERHCILLREYWMMRKAREIASEILTDEPSDVLEFLDKKHKDIEQVIDLSSLGSGDVGKDVHEALANQLDKHLNPDKYEGVVFGIDALDREVEPERGDLLLVAGTPGMGKTAFGLQMSYSQKAGMSGAYFSREMKRKSLMKRVLARWSNLDMAALFGREGMTQEQFDEVVPLANSIGDRKVEVFDDLRYIEDVAIKCRQKKRKDGLDWVVIDYCQQFDTREDSWSEENRISRISWQAKQIAMELDCVVVLLSQLNRELAKTKRLPRLPDLRGSGSLEQDADIVLFPFNSKAVQWQDEQGEFFAKIVVAKYRNGEPQILDRMEFNGLKQEWKEQAHDYTDRRGQRWAIDKDDQGHATGLTQTPF